MDRALELKADRLASRALEGRSVALVFDLPSTRTRVSFETGVYELGGHPLVLREGELQLARGESARDTALVLSRMVQAIAIRTPAQETVEALAEHGSVPVINMLTREHHPCQALADLVTLRERFGRLEGLRLAYVGDGNNMARSLLRLGELAGVEVVVASPPELALPDAEPTSLEQAVDGAHALYTDVWMSMGDGADRAEKRRLLEPYRLDEALLSRARDDAIALHCLPAHPGRGDLRGVALRRALRRVGPGGESAARSEGAARAADGPLTEYERTDSHPAA